MQKYRKMPIFRPLKYISTHRLVHPCKFSIWRNISGHAVSVEEVKQICEQGITRDCIEFYKEDGTVYYKRLQLTPEKDRIIMI